jgi:pyroglutamyl-peptidase
MSPRLLICGFGAFPEAPKNPAQAVIESLAAAGWSPPGADAAYLVLPVAWSRSAETVLEALAREPADAVLVVGVAVSAEAFHVERLGRNAAACERPDHDGALWPHPEILPGAGPEQWASAPTRSMLAAIERAGLPARLSEDAGDYLCNFTLYRLLAANAAPAVGFLHTPQARECAEGARFSLADIEAAVRAAAEAMAQVLSRPDAAMRSA